MFAAIDDVNLHLGMELQARQKLRCDEEILTCALLAGDVDHTLVHHALVAWIHTLIDLIDNPEWCLRKVLEGHEVEDCRDGALTARLAVRVEDGHGLAFAEVIVSQAQYSKGKLVSLPKADRDLDGPVVEVFVVLVH